MKILQHFPYRSMPGLSPWLPCVCYKQNVWRRDTVQRWIWYTRSLHAVVWHVQQVCNIHCRHLLRSCLVSRYNWNQNHYTSTKIWRALLSLVYFSCFFWDPFVAAWNHCGFSLHQVPVGSIFSFFVLFCFLNSVCFFVFTALEKKEVIFHPRSRPQEKDQKTWGSQNTVKSFWDVKCLDERGLDLIISLRTHNTVVLLG